jgi:hypothetical protein
VGDLGPSLSIWIDSKISLTAACKRSMIIANGRLHSKAQSMSAVAKLLQLPI